MTRFTEKEYEEFLESDMWVYLLGIVTAWDLEKW